MRPTERGTGEEAMEDLRAGVARMIHNETKAPMNTAMYALVDRIRAALSSRGDAGGQEAADVGSIQWLGSNLAKCRAWVGKGDVDFDHGKITSHIPTYTVGHYRDWLVKGTDGFIYIVQKEAYDALQPDSAPTSSRRPGTQVEGEEPIVLMRRRDPNGYFDQFGYEWWMPIEGDRATPSRAVGVDEALEPELARLTRIAESVRRENSWDANLIDDAVDQIRAALSSQTAGEAVAWVEQESLDRLASAEDGTDVTLWTGPMGLPLIPLYLRHLSNGQQDG